MRCLRSEFWVRLPIQFMSRASPIQTCMAGVFGATPMMSAATVLFILSNKTIVLELNVNLKAIFD